MNLQFESVHFVYKPTSTEDEDLFLEIYTNSEIMKFVATPLSFDDATKLYESSLLEWDFQSRKLLTFVIRCKKTDGKIGLCGVKTSDIFTKQGHIGVMLLSKYQSMGFGTEILIALSAFCFNSLGYHKLLGPPVPGNTKSIKMLLNAGYQKEAVLRDNWIIDGQYIDTPLYTLIETDFRKQFTSELC